MTANKKKMIWGQQIEKQTVTMIKKIHNFNTTRTTVSGKGENSQRESNFFLWNPNKYNNNKFISN